MDSIEKRVKEHLKAGKSLTVLDGLRLFKTIDLRKTISTLRREGMQIDDEWVANENTKKKFKRYFLRGMSATEKNSTQNTMLFHEEE